MNINNLLCLFHDFKSILVTVPLSGLYISNILIIFLCLCLYNAEYIMSCIIHSNLYSECNEHLKSIILSYPSVNSIISSSPHMDNFLCIIHNFVFMVLVLKPLTQSSISLYNFLSLSNLSKQSLYSKRLRPSYIF